MDAKHRTASLRQQSYLSLVSDPRDGLGDLRGKVGRNFMAMRVVYWVNFF